MNDKKHIFFENGFQAIKKAFDEVSIFNDNETLKNVVSFLSVFLTYEEEERKLRASIIFCTNINEVLRAVPNKECINIAKGEKTASDLIKKIKPILSFSCNGWYLFMEQKMDSITYGICKSFTGPKGVLFKDLLINDSSNSMFVLAEAKNNHELNLIYNNKLRIINNCYDQAIDHNLDEIYDQLLDHLTLGFGNDIRNDAKRIYKKIVNLFPDRLHGAILLIVKDNIDFIHEYISDGIFIEKPLNIIHSANFIFEKYESVIESEKFFSISGLFIEMLNNDGITIVDAKGNILAYNIFVNTNLTKEKIKQVSGGARKRAAYALQNIENIQILGIYFQSQDGYITYYEGCKNE